MSKEMVKWTTLQCPDTHSTEHYIAAAFFGEVPLWLYVVRKKASQNSICRMVFYVKNKTHHCWTHIETTWKEVQQGRRQEGWRRPVHSMYFWEKMRDNTYPRNAFQQLVKIDYKQRKHRWKTNRRDRRDHDKFEEPAGKGEKSGGQLVHEKCWDGWASGR